MSFRQKFLRDCITQIKKAIGDDVEEQPEFESKDIFLQKGADIIGLHTFGDATDQGFQQYEAWCNLYDLEFKFLGSIYRIFGPIEEEATELKNDGWVEVQKPKGAT